MQKKSIKKKRYTRILTALILTICICVGIGAQFLVKAEGYMTGIESVVIDKNKNNQKYQILEIVPTHEDGEIGYLVGGQEPQYLTDRLGEWILANTNKETSEITNTKENREQYINKTLQLLQSKGICGTSADSSTPIYYTEYKEQYFLTESDNAESWNVVEFDSNHYEMTELEGQYEEADNGSYIKNIIGFEYVGLQSKEANYVVKFAKLTGGLNSIPKENQAWGVYRYANEIDAKSGYQLATEEEISEKKVQLFYVSGYEYLPGNEEASYTHILNSEKPYSYVGTDGDSEFIPGSKESSVESQKAVVEIGKIYFQGGFTNNEWLKNDVFKTVNDDEQDLEIEVLKKTPNELSDIALDKIDLIYIYGGDANAYKDNTSGLDWNTVYNIFSRIVANKKIPCIVDASIISNLSNKQNSSLSYLDKLSILCLQSNMKDIFDQIEANGKKEPDFSTLLGTMKETNSYNWIQGNVLCFNNTNHNQTGFLTASDWLTEISKEQIILAYKEILLYIQQENLYRGKDEKLSESITKAVCLQYIINFSYRTPLTTKNKIKVLEIEPCAEYSLTKKMVLDWTKGKTTLTESAITIDTMTTAEFIGKIDDLNTEYDMIYIGMNIGKMHKSGNSTIFNDTSMNGLVYMHTGDSVICSPQIAGLLDRDYVNGNRSNYLYTGKDRNNTSIFGIRQSVVNGAIKIESTKNNVFNITLNSNIGVYRYSGNDITEEKMNDLLDFVAANYPVVLADGFYKTNEDGTRGVNDRKVDTSSYIYDFVKETIDENYSNVLSVSDINALDSSGAEVFSYYINMPKIELTFLDNNDQAIESSDSYDKDVVKRKEENGMDYLYIRFKISNNMNTSAYTRYIPSFYIDLNADGKFSSKTELFPSNDARILDASGKQVTTKDKDGNYLLQANTTYILKKQIPSTYQSIMTWKLEIKQQSNEYVRTSKVLYTSINEIDWEKETETETKIEPVRVLQIRVNQGVDSALANTWDLASDDRFKNLLNDKKNETGLNFEIISQQANDYVTSYKSDRNYLNKYDMIIIGFADAYQEISDPGAVKAILEYIESGKSVLFTHDTTSFINVAKKNYREYNGDGSAGSALASDTWYWGYNFSRYLRNIVGMDRYGIMDEKSEDGVNDLLQTGNLLNLDENGNRAELESSGKDIAYVSGTNKKFSYGETQGYTNHLLNAKILEGYGMNYRSLSGIGSHYGDAVLNKTTPVEVTQVNEGQITSFPYKIEKNFKVAPTHYQYYQLDLERDSDEDGESDIVVWYCLGERENSKDKNPYVFSPNDVRNSYYIYSIGNVMYSGVGHSTVTDSNLEEKKLFANTVVAAYKAGVKPPTVTILKDKYIDSEEKEFEYLTFDEVIGNQLGNALDKEITLYYSVADPNLVTTQKRISVEYYIGSTEKKENLKTYSIEGAEIASNSLESGQVYMVKVPIADLLNGLGNKDSLDITVKVISEFNYYGEEVTKDSSDTLKVIKTNLLDLN